GPRTRPTLRRLRDRRTDAPARTAAAIRGLRVLATTTPGSRRVRTTAGLLEGSARRGPVRVGRADRPPAARYSNGVGYSPPVRAAGGSQRRGRRAGAARRVHVVHGAPGRVPGGLAPLQRPGGFLRRHPGGGARPAGVRRAGR